MIQNKQDTSMTPSMIYCMYSFMHFHQCIFHCILHTMHRFAKSDTFVFEIAAFYNTNEIKNTGHNVQFEA